MQPRFVGRLGLADAVTVGNAMLGFLAAFVATRDAGLAARIVLLAAVLDGLDGVIARKRGGTLAGPYLDSLADVASFGVAPALLVSSRAADAWTVGGDPVKYGLALLLPAIYVAMAVTRLGLYTAYDSDASETKGVPSTLAATVLSAGVLAGFVGPGLLVALSGLLAALMVTQITYPDLHPQDAIVMGVVQVLAIFLRGRPGEVFAFALLFLALAYLFLGPRFYWT
ncbi:protein sorting system archaetidylserine synthase [Haloplanus aerogenes]|uniref:CDP-diacylglycerol--serine O-phosphatidyltransferase n=1 Tax=Haloplanus aerogenes TaxID=660522 RepID=A0A3M0DSP6_9EURY|nr:protein sorting system archaetidylserine synthase [Haloplanus aerogenes]AZH26174.1 phosphatidylcholine/phosphatidylserine synthase [Haloplanus aerogenes]RMB18373.1 CDP-diacylglycerol--serine O-phosphatidyltransferase [Haloplanus aerogenes]